MFLRQRLRSPLFQERLQCAAETGKFALKILVDGSRLAKILVVPLGLQTLGRTHGGAVAAERLGFEFDFVARRQANQRAKRAIAAEALRLLQPGFRVLLDAGTTTLELAAIIKNSMPGAALREKQHPDKRSFQALRIAVNDELSAIENMLQNAPDCLRSGGRIAVISFHSLEDRLVKNAFRKRDKGCVCPPDFPECRCGFVRSLKVITQKPITASPEELERNPRSRSAKLRVAEKI